MQRQIEAEGADRNPYAEDYGAAEKGSGSAFSNGKGCGPAPPTAYDGRMGLHDSDSIGRRYSGDTSFLMYGVPFIYSLFCSFVPLILRNLVGVIPVCLEK